MRGIDVEKRSLRAPSLLAYVDPFIQSIQIECFDHFLVFCENLFVYLVRE